jgi:hypothetical protein
MISLSQSPYAIPLSGREAAVATAQQMFPNMLVQLLAQVSAFTGVMVNHIERHQNLYERCPAYMPTKSKPAFETLTPPPGVDQSVMIDGEYRLDVTKNGTSSSTYKVYDKSGKELAGAWGDPHMTGKDGAAVGDMQGNHVLKLPNGAQIAVRVSDGDGNEAKNGGVAYCSEITAVSANGEEAMNFNFNNGTNKPTTGTHISGYLGQNFIAETLGDHGPFLGAQLGVSKEGGLFDPLTGQSMTAQRLKELDLKNGDPVAREKAVNLAMAQQLFEQGYVTPLDNLLYGNKNFNSFTDPMRNQCTNNLQSLLLQMMSMNASGCGCDIRLPNHIDSELDIMLQSFGQFPKPYACPTLSAAYNPMMACQMPEGAACRVIDVYMKQNNLGIMTPQEFQRLAQDPSVPPLMRNACSWMLQHPDAFDRIEQMDVPNQKDHISGRSNFANRAKQLGTDGWNPLMSSPIDLKAFFRSSPDLLYPDNRDSFRRHLMYGSVQNFVTVAG